MQLQLLDLEQGASRGLEMTEGSVGSMLGEAGVEPSFWEQMSEPSDSEGTVYDRPMETQWLTQV